MSTIEIGETWDQLNLTYEKDLFNSLTKIRIPLLKKIQLLVKSNSIPEKDLDDLSLCLLKTYSFYQDTNSRTELLSTLECIVRNNKRFYAIYIRFVLKVASATSLALTDYFTLLTWINRFIQYGNEMEDDVLESGIRAQAVLLDRCLEKSFGIKAKHTRRVYDSVLVTGKASLTQFLQSRKDALEFLIDAVLKPTSKLDPSSVLVFIGVLSTSVIALQPVQPALDEILNNLKNPILEYYINQVILSKAPPAKYASVVFVTFLKNYIATDNLDNLFGAFDKAIMRSSENSFGNLLPPFITSLAENSSYNDLLANSKLFSSVLTGLKSPKENVRNGAFYCVNKVLDKGPSEEIIPKVIDELFKLLKAVTSAEIKVSVIELISSVKTSGLDSASKIISNILPIIAKDQNELTLSASVRVLLTQYFHALYNKWDIPKTEIEKLNKTLIAGINEKKINLRKVWIILLADQLYSALQRKADLLNISPIFESLIPSLVKTLEEAQQSPLPTVNSKGISSAYAIVYILDSLKDVYSLENALLFEKSLTSSKEKPSILSSVKLLTKLTDHSEYEWLARALTCVVSDLDHVDEASRIDYGLTWIFLCISNKISYELRLSNLNQVKYLLSEKPEALSTLLIQNIFRILHNEEGLKDQDLELDLKKLAPIFSVLTQLSDEATRKQNLMKLLVPANHEMIPINNRWVGLAQRGHMDAGLVAEQNSKAIMDTLINVVTTSKDKAFYNAAVKTVGIITFINPEVFAPLVASILNENLDLEKVEGIDSETLKIWNGKDGELVVDVLNTGKKTEDKNSKDYDLKKWEESLKKELANKGKVKLSKEQQNQVNEQLAKESAIRSSVNTIVSGVVTGIDFINELVTTSHQVENGAKYWYPVALSTVLNLAKLPSLSDIFNDLLVNSFLNLSDLISSRLGQLKKFIGVAILRINNVQGLTSNYTEESLESLLSRILFRIKILSDQNPLDALSLSYILLLLETVLERGKAVAIKNSTKQKVSSEFVEEDPEEEHLLLAIEIISLHAEVFEDNSIERANILEVLISLMKLPGKAKMAKECFLSMCQHISVNVTKSDLKILFDNIISPETFVRVAILEGIDSEFDLTEELKYSNEIWIAVHDNDENARNIACTIWEDNSFEIPNDAPSQLLNFSGNKDSGLRLSIANAIFSATKILRERNGVNVFDEILNQVIDLYRVKKDPPPPALDKFGLVIKSSISQKDAWEERSTVALLLKLFTPFYNEESIQKVFKFLVEERALGDKEDMVRQELQDAGIEIIKEHGADHIQSLIPIFEANLAEKDKGVKSQDTIKESVIILYGALARHLESSDDRLNVIIDRLIKTLDTPSEDVQYAVSECIAPLVHSFESRLGEYFQLLLDKLFNGKNLASRRGAAYGIAGLVKGAGIKSLSSYDLIRDLTEASEDKKNTQRREGVSFAFECLSQSLGKYFEPYVIEVLPIILKSLGDLNPEVREATDMAAKQIMKNTTSYGIKKLIPVAISNLDDVAWRSKKGSVELLGSMAYLDPTQLSASLSTIVPEIVGVLNDTHKEVRKAADQALKRFGDVIRNPEIQAIVPDLINAIGDPTKYTDVALDKLIRTQFVHYIDGPSLALIIHVIHRGMRDRSAAVKRKACQIVGNMAILVDSKDLGPYLPTLISELEISMVDPVPATRSTAARALGSLVEKLGEEQFPELIPRLLDTLQDESKAGDRLGSAQALAEVISGLGINKLEELLPTILSAATSPRNHIRAGFMPLLLFLPVCFGSQFSPYLNRIIPPILKGLADVDEDIRDTALRAGRLIVKNYAKKAVDLLLPELEAGLSDSNYRIRLSSVELTGDLLFQVTGISGKNELSEDQGEYSGEVNNTLIEVLGQERRDNVLSLLFVCRSDVTGIVRSAAVDIWKALVANTPRTIKEILPSLAAIIVRKLASSDETQRTIAAQTLGEMVRRVGASALSRLLPTLEESFATSDSDARQGICIALAELIKSANKDTLVEFQDVFFNTIREALVDQNDKVREAAANVFEVLQEELGKTVIDEVIPYLLNMLESEDSENALLALQDIMAAKSEVIFPLLLSTLLSPPMDSFKATALSSLASVAGLALYKKLSVIINTLVNAVIEAKNMPEEDQQKIKESFDKILLSIDDDEGVHPLMQQLLSLVKHEDNEKRAVIYERLASFFAGTNLDYSVYLQDMVSQFIMSLSDKTPEVVSGTFAALTALVKRQSKESLEKLVKPARQALNLTGVKGEELPAFSLPKGPNCILPIFLHGLMYGNGEQRELSALGIADIIDKTPSANLRPFATIITGPLIRVIGEKVSSDIKAAILVALNNLLNKIPQALRPFIPQLQRTFVRSLSDVQNDSLRSKAVIALGTLIKFQPRVDSLVTELVTAVKNSSDKGVKTSMLKAMLGVVNNAGHNMNEASKSSIMTLVEEEISIVDDKSAVAYARLLGSLSKILSTEEAASILKSKILDKDVEEGKFSILSINSFLKYSPNHIFETGLIDEIINYIVKCSECSNDYISDNATVAIGKILLLLKESKSPFSEESKITFELDENLLLELVTVLAKLCLAPISNSPDTRRLSLVAIRTIARFKFEVSIKPYLNILAPSVFSCLRDPIIPIKLAAEKAYLSVFRLIEEPNMETFNSWFEQNSVINNVLGATIQPRSVGDYTKRVAVRLANVERERVEAGGDEETIFSDRFEDENEVWAVGGVDNVAT